MILRSTGTIAALATLSVVSFLLASPALAAPDGGLVFKQRCQACHSVTPGAPASIAPNLAGVVGRKAASSAYSYSPALKASKLVWTKTNLGTFLSGPQQMVPGTRMVIRVADPADRAALIEFLARTGH